MTDISTVAQLLAAAVAVPSPEVRVRTPEELSRWTVSPSQIEAFSPEHGGCNRKFAWKYIAHKDAASSPAAAIGGDVHTQLERYLLTGELPDQSTREGEIATAGLHLIPEGGSLTQEQVEMKIRFRSPAGWWFGGRVDYTYSYTTPGGIIPVVGDHKTTGNFKWAKTPEDLAHNPQALIYGADALLDTGADYVDLEWTYYRTKGSPQSMQTRLTLHAQDIEERFPVLDEVAKRIHHTLATVTDPLTLEPTIETCDKFGGCPYQHLCNLSVSDRIRSRTMNLPPPLPGLPGAPNVLVPVPMPALPQAAPIPQNTQDLLARLTAQAAPPAPAQMSVLDRLRAQVPQAAPQVVIGTVPPVPALPASAAPVSMPLPPQNATVPVPVAPPAPPPAPAAAPPSTPPTPAPGVWYQAADGQLYYPHTDGQQLSVARVTAMGGRFSDGTPVPGAEIFCGPLGAVAINPPESVLPHAMVPPPPPPAAPKATKQKKNNGPALGQVPNPAPFGAQAIPEGQTAKPIQILLIDCLPRGSHDVKNAEEVFFSPARHAVNTSQGVEDYRIMDYGKGAGIFVACINRLLSSGETWNIISVDSRSYDAQQALSSLIASAAFVIQGRG